MAPDFKRAASVGAISIGFAVLGYYAYQSIFGSKKTIDHFSPEEESKWHFKFQNQEVLNHRKVGLAVGGIQSMPFMTRARSLPSKVRSGSNFVPPAFTRATSAPQVTSSTLTPEMMEKQESVKTLTPEVSKTTPEISKELTPEVPKDFEDYKDTQEDEQPQSAKDLVEKMTVDEQDDLLDDLLGEEDDKMPKVDEKIDERYDLIYSFNWLVELLPESALACVFEFMGFSQYFQLGREGFHIPKDVFLDNPKLVVQGASDIRYQPTLVFTVGAPGSGKTTWARYVYGEEAVIAADDWFDKFNEGAFNRKHLSTAHNWCKSQILNRLERNENAVCNNTNTTLSEMYELTAAVYFGQLPHKIVFAIMPELNAKVLFKRNAHSVPLKSIKNMLRNLGKARGRYDIREVLKSGPMRQWRKARTARFEGKDILYTGLFLDKASVATLRDLFCDNMQQPLLPKLMNGHVTLAFQPGQPAFDKLPRGKRIQVRVIGLASSPVVQCARVEILDEDVAEMCTNEHPHVTLAVERRFSPVMSNHLLKYGGWIEIEEDVILDCTVGFFQNSKVNIAPKSFMRSVSNYWLGDEDMEEELR